MKQLIIGVLVGFLLIGGETTSTTSPKMEKEKTQTTVMKNLKKPLKSSKKDTTLFNVTAYCGCYECSEGYGNKTATGTIAQEGRTIAVDPTVIPYGTEVIIQGKTYIAEDCGGLIKGNDIDIFFENHTKVKNFGKKQLPIKLN